MYRLHECEFYFSHQYNFSNLEIPCVAQNIIGFEHGLNSRYFCGTYCISHTVNVFLNYEKMIKVFKMIQKIQK